MNKQITLSLIIMLSGVKIFTSSNQPSQQTSLAPEYILVQYFYSHDPYGQLQPPSYYQLLPVRYTIVDYNQQTQRLVPCTLVDYNNQETRPAITPPQPANTDSPELFQPRAEDTEGIMDEFYEMHLQAMQEMQASPAVANRQPEGDEQTHPIIPDGKALKFTAEHQKDADDMRRRMNEAAQSQRPEASGNYRRTHRIYTRKK